PVKIKSLIRLREKAGKRAARNASSRVPASLSSTVASCLFPWSPSAAMTQPQADFDKDEPLSPEAEAVMAKARRRAAISMLVMLIGFMAVVLVVVYRLVTMGSDVSDRYALQSIALPADAQVISSQVQDG